MKRAALIAAAVALSGCTAVNMASLPTRKAPGDIFVTQEGIKDSYESIGVVQITRKGVLLFGFADPAGTDLPAAMQELDTEIRRAGADGAINARFEQTQYTLPAKIFAAIFFFWPLPSEVRVTGELVRLRQAAMAPPMALVAPTQPGAPL